MQNIPAITEIKKHNTIDDDEIAKFTAMADSWWDVKGPFKPLHDITPLRIGYIKEQLCGVYKKDVNALRPLEGLSVLDVGCGGGLASEPLARLGAEVTGIDASEKNIAIARLHAEKTGLAVDYRSVAAEILVAEGKRYDVVVALEIIEHVADVPAFLHALANLTKENGVLFLSTINRTMKSLLFAKIGAEYILRWLPIGTHDWNKFLRPSEMILPLENDNMTLLDMKGMIYQPLQRKWLLSDDEVNVNYLLSFHKKPAKTSENLV